MISNAYQYYISTYGHRQTTRYDTHKRSELKKVYNAIIKLNKRSPLYKVDLSENTQKFMIDLKEHARFYRAALLEAIRDTDEGNVFPQKDICSSDPDILEVSFAKGSSQNIEELEEGELYHIKIDQLATPQINTGDFISSDRKDIPGGEYSFDLTVHSSSYEFQFVIPPHSTNLEVQEKLSRLINQSNVGLNASVLKDENGSSAIKLTSLQTGLSPYEASIFHVSDEESNNKIKLVEFLGLDQISSEPLNAHLTANGREILSPTNNILLDRNFSLTLKNITEEGYVSIGMKRSANTIIHHINSIVNGYNNIYDLAMNGSERYGSNKLAEDLEYVTKRFQTALENSGICLMEDGHLMADEALIMESFENGEFDRQSCEIVNYRNALIRQLSRLSLDPIAYLNKKMISYPNPIRSYSNPYHVSEYSGIMFNGYI